MRAREEIMTVIVRALDSAKEVLAIFAEAADADSAQELQGRWSITALQATAISDMQFRRNSQAERQRVLEELAELRAGIERLSGGAS